jgi:hypothetical protein
VALRLGTPVSHLFHVFGSPTSAFTVAFVALAALAFASTWESLALPDDAGSALNPAGAR